MEQENKQEDGDLAEASAKSESSEKKTPKLLKAKSKIAKSRTRRLVKAKNATDPPKVQGEEKNKSVLEGNTEGSGVEQKNGEELNLTAEDQNDTKDVIEKNKQIQASTEKIGGSDNSGQKLSRKRSGAQNKKSVEKCNDTGKRQQTKEHDGLEKNRPNKGKHDNMEKRQQTKEHDGPENNRPNKGKDDDMEKRQQNENKKEKLGGLIFMCNAKTKPDCFRYRVMGVSMSKKDIVMSVKRGLKLFLYDYDLKLMYGVYEASSSGGMKLEPEAFGGAFPVQVRFNVHKDCYPLPESALRTAMKENYERNKFKTELTPKQVRKLMQLFRPAAVYSTALPIHSSPMAVDRDGVRETSGRDPYASSRSDLVRPHERDLRLPYREVASTQRDEVPRDLYLSEKEYRAYGLMGERRNLTCQHQIVSASDAYERDYDSHFLRRPDSVYKETMAMQRETVHADPLYLTEREYRTYDVGARRELLSPVPAVTATVPAAAVALDSYDPFHPSNYSAPSVDPYAPLVRRETYLSESDAIQRRGTDPLGRLYSTYAANALSEYNHRHHYQGTKPDATSALVSSRYSFAGPSLSFR